MAHVPGLSRHKMDTTTAAPAAIVKGFPICCCQWVEDDCTTISVPVGSEHAMNLCCESTPMRCDAPAMPLVDVAGAERFDVFSCLPEEDDGDSSASSQLKVGDPVSTSSPLVFAMGFMAEGTEESTTPGPAVNTEVVPLVAALNMSSSAHTTRTAARGQRLYPDVANHSVPTPEEGDLPWDSRWDGRSHDVDWLVRKARHVCCCENSTLACREGLTWIPEVEGCCGAQPQCGEMTFLPDLPHWETFDFNTCEKIPDAQFRDMLGLVDMAAGATHSLGELCPDECSSCTIPIRPQSRGLFVCNAPSGMPRGISCGVVEACSKSNCKDMLWCLPGDEEAGDAYVSYVATYGDSSSTKEQSRPVISPKTAAVSAVAVGLAIGAALYFSGMAG